jgi:predicted DNA-binding ribbon-helix-helix protein
MQRRAPSPRTHHVPDSGGAADGGLANHNIIIGTRRTSFRLDRTTWNALQQILRREGVTLDELGNAINSEKPRTLSLTVAIRVAVLRYFMDAATETGHDKAGHGGRFC